MVLPRFFERPLRSAAGRPLAAFAALLVTLAGCGEKPEDIQRQTAELEKAFPGLAAAAPARSGRPGATVDASAYVKAALSASRSNDYGTAVIMLQKAAESPGVTPEQVMAIQTARKAWVADLMTRAAQGDEKAKAALAAIEASH